MRTLNGQAKAVSAREVSPVELVSAALDAIDRVQPRLNAFTHVLSDEALARAKELTDLPPAGPLHGVPVAVKDLYDMSGVPTTGCCAAYADRVATSDSAVVEALLGAGAIIVAKTNQHELACGATTQISSFGPAFNPWNPGHIPGGSSGGSGAAVGAGVVAMAMGSDTGGSIRIPSSFCGVTGLKPTHGAISLRGAMPMCPTLDTGGPLAVTAQDCMLTYRVIAGFDLDYPWSADGTSVHARGVDGVRVGLLTSFRPVNPESRAGVERAARTLEEMGAVVEQIEGPTPEEALAAFGGMGIPQTAHCFRDLWDDPRVHPEIAAFLAFGRSISGPDYFAGLEMARKVRRDFDAALTSCDVLIAPTTPFPAPPADAEEAPVQGGVLDVRRGGPAWFTLPVNIAGLPAVALPVGFSSEGLPLGAQLIGRPWSEETLLAVATAYQEATDWHTRRPPASD